METVKDKSYGVVPVIKKDDEWEVLLVHQISYRGSNDRFWTFPKGHPDDGEEPVETARRELMEETGLSNVQIITDAAFSIQYSFVHEDKKIAKTVTYYLGVSSDDLVKITLPDEIADLGWFNFKEASDKLTHTNAQQVLLEAGQYLNEHSDLT